MADYMNTPSFFNDEDFFNRYLGNTSYYLGLQRIVDKIVNLLQPDCVLELGSALGTTSIMLSDKYPHIRFIGNDLREDVVEQAVRSAKGRKNISFISGDMCELVKSSLEKYQLIFMLYSFHHIHDPLDKKIEFLNNCYTNMKPGSYLLIAETFLPETTKSLEKEDSIAQLWKMRALEGYASTYWSALNALSEDGLSNAHKVALTSKQEELEAGRHVFRREDEYLVKFSWLREQAEKSGFKEIIAEPVNCIEENTLLLRKGAKL